MEKYNRRIFLIDSEGILHSNENAISHEELAKYVIENDEELKEEFKKSRMKLELAFLLKKGWIYGTESDRYKEIVCLSKEVSDKVRKIIGQYYEEGYKPYDLEKLYGEEFLNEFFGEIEEQKEEKREIER